MAKTDHLDFLCMPCWANLVLKSKANKEEPSISSLTREPIKWDAVARDNTRWRLQDLHFAILGAHNHALWWYAPHLAGLQVTHEHRYTVLHLKTHKQWHKSHDHALWWHAPHLAGLQVTHEHRHTVLHLKTHKQCRISHMNKPSDDMSCILLAFRLHMNTATRSCIWKHINSGISHMIMLYDDM